MGTETDKMRQDIYQQLKFIFGEHVRNFSILYLSTYNQHTIQFLLAAN
jgi:hypothetical protein